jgi:hypothetical protein
MVVCESLDLTNKTYEEVDTIIHGLAGIPEEVSWDSLAGCALKGLVPKEKSQNFYELVNKDRKYRNQSELTHRQLEKECEYFRLSNHLMKYFDVYFEVIQSYVYQKTIRVFMINSYEKLYHNENTLDYGAEFLQGLSGCFKPCNIHIYSITKNTHSGGSSRDTPFRRPYLAMMVVSES